MFMLEEFVSVAVEKENISTTFGCKKQSIKIVLPAMKENEKSMNAGMFIEIVLFFFSR